MRILKMDYKRQTTVLSVVFILAGMMLLVPAITDKVLAFTAGGATSGFPFHFSNLRSHLDAGKFKFGPTLSPTGVIANWATAGTAVFGGDEKGYVLVDVVCDIALAHVCDKGGVVVGTATFHFNNPDSGANTCKTDVSNNLLLGTCNITGGAVADATYRVCEHLASACLGLTLIEPLHLPSIPGNHLPPP